MGRGRKPAVPAGRPPVANHIPLKRNRKTLKGDVAISDDELSEGGLAEMVHEKSGGKWTAFAERAEEPKPMPEDDENAAENGAADEDDEEGEDDEDMDEDV